MKTGEIHISSVPRSGGETQRDPKPVRDPVCAVKDLVSTVETPSSILGQPEQQAPLEVSVVIPCLNEAESIEQCVHSAIEVLQRHAIAGEIIVADNDSDDDSPRLAAAAGAIVVHEPERGYGSAYLAGFAAARGRYILMADADLTYDFEEIPRFLAELNTGADMVIGNRMKNIRPGAMSWHHRYIGNPLLSGLLNLLFRTGVDDAHCGMRALRRDLLPRLDLRTTGMEFASEMVIRAAKEDLEIRQFAIDYHPREGESKLSSFRDGWRHLRFLLVHSPNHLFIFPGAVMALIGFLVELIVLTQIGVFGRQWNIHALIGGALLAIVGTQVVALGICAHAYGTYFMGERDRWFDRMRARYKLEHGLLLGGALLLAGLIVGAVIVIDWIQRGFGVLSEERLAVLAATLIIVGIQIFFSSFLLSILGLRRRRR
jgi:glycosyltransferase involved in cell wall biosynthesis